MSDARPITNVTEFVCGSCWNGFGIKDPGVRQTGGEVVCPHCGHVQPRPEPLTARVIEAIRREDDEDDEEVGIGDEPAVRAPVAPEEAAVEPAPEAAAVEPAPAAVDPAPAVVVVPAESKRISGGLAVAGTEDEAGFDSELAAEDTSVEGADASSNDVAIIEREPTEPDLDAEDLQAAAAAIIGEPEPEPEPAPSTATTRTPAPTAEELLAYLTDAVIGEEAAPIGRDTQPMAASEIGIDDDTGAFEVEASAAGSAASVTHSSVDVAGFGEVDPFEDTGAFSRQSGEAVGLGDDHDAFEAEMAAALAEADAMETADTEDDDALDVMIGSTLDNAVDDVPVEVIARPKAPDLGATTRMPTRELGDGGEPGDGDGSDGFDIAAEVTAPEVSVPTDLPEPSEWKLRSPPGLTYNFHSLDALLGWASNRNHDDLQVSIDGKEWRPVRPFLEAVRAGQKGRAAFEFAGQRAADAVVAAAGADGRTALDDIRAVDVRDEVLRSIESRTGQAPALEVPVATGSATRKTKVATTAPEDEESEAELLDAETAEQPRAPSQPSTRSSARVPAASSRVSGTTAAASKTRTTGPNSRVSSTRHKPVARKQESGNKTVVIAVVAVVVLAGVGVALKVFGVF